MKVSVVIPIRNDNFSGNLLGLATYSLNTMTRTFDEVILVEFGSPEYLYPKIEEQMSAKRGNLRVIKVPIEWTNTVIPPDVTFADVLARNIGIRRAKNNVIVSSNIDIVPSKFDRFDLTQFNEESFYSSNKFMIEHSLVVSLRATGMSWEDIQEHLFENKDKFYRQPMYGGDPWSKVSGCGDFQIGHRNIWFDDGVRGFEESLIYKDYTDSNLQKKIIENARREVLPGTFFYMFHQSHNNIRGIVRSNDVHASLWNFGPTTNPETWGFSDITFEEYII